MAEPKHGTAEEMQFITWLGRRVHRNVAESSRINILQAYRDALLRRIDWHGLDRLAILRHIDAEISAEEAAA